MIGTRVGGVESAVVDGETGILVTAGDNHALADAMCRLLSDEVYAKRLGAQGRKRVEDTLSWEKITCRVAGMLSGPEDVPARQRQVSR